jgi:hypothetical protein
MKKLNNKTNKIIEYAQKFNDENGVVCTPIRLKD